MKSLMPWICLMATASAGTAYALNGLEAYRQGDYVEAADKLSAQKEKDPIADFYLGQMRLYGYGQLKNNPLAFKHLKASAEKGFLEAQKMLAMYSLLGEKDPEQALIWFKKASANNDTQAHMYCAAAYLFGYGTKKNPDIAKKYYIAAAKNGNSIAQYTLAEEFINSKQAANKKLGMIWLAKSLEQNNPKAQLLMGRLYEQGSLVARDPHQAETLIKASAAQGYIPAFFALGELAEQQKNVTVAMELYRKAADQGYAPAQMGLANLYIQPGHPWSDPHRGFLWMLKAAEEGSSEARLALSNLYKKGEGVDSDDNLAEEWKKKSTHAAKSSYSPLEEASRWLSNDKASHFAGANFQMQGILQPWQNPQSLVENNYNAPPQMELITREALYKPRFTMVDPNVIPISELYDALLAASQDKKTQSLAFPQYPINAQQVPGNKPDGVAQKQNEQKVFQQLYQEAILGNPLAQFDIAQRYQQGIGVQKNIQEALRFYTQAYQQEDLRAGYTLAMIYLMGQDIPPDYDKGMQLLTQAAFKGNVYAQYALANIKEKGYRDGQGQEIIKPDLDQAIAMYSIAASNDYGLAQFQLADILVQDHSSKLSEKAKQQKTELIKNLYEGAVKSGVAQAELPLAYFYAMDEDKNKQAKAFEIANKEAQKGNPKGAILLGLLFDRGIAVAKNPDEAINWYQQAAINPVNAFILGTYYSQGKGLSTDVEKGKALLQQAADHQFSYAYLNLAVLNKQQNQAFLPDLDKALSLGNSMAGLLLADYYLSQNTDVQNMKQARGIYQQFAEKGDKNAQLKLGFMAEIGLGGAVDIADAQKWYAAAAGQGQPVAQFLLGRLYQLGEVNAQPDYAEAKKWYMASQKTYSPSAIALGFIYDTVDFNYPKASQAYAVAANREDPIAEYDLGLIYEKGKGIKPDFAKAGALYLKAAEKGHSQAMVQLAGLYFNGSLDGRDEQQALHWYKKAADLGNREAFYHLGLLAETGVGTKLNYEQAQKYYQLAADKGDMKAMIALARMYQYGLGVPSNDEKAAQIYQTLSAHNNAYAQYQLATYYFSDKTGHHQPQQIKQLLQQAQENGSRQAQLALQWINSHTQAQTSFIEPAMWNRSVLDSDQSADLMYLNALNEWNRGDVEETRMILNRLVAQYPHYLPAKQAYDKLSQQLRSHFAEVNARS